MRKKVFVALAFVFALAFTLGATAPAEAIGGGGRGDLDGCYTKCSCTGSPVRCCPTSDGGEICTPTFGFQCPHIITC